MLLLIIFGISWYLTGSFIMAAGWTAVIYVIGALIGGQP
jgi:hypothetical protein